MRHVFGRYGTGIERRDGTVKLDREPELPRTGNLCACCGERPGVMGLGGEGIPACDVCITMLPAEVFEARVKAWKARQ